MESDVSVPTVRTRLLRPQDLLSLEVQAVNLRLDTRGPDGPRLVRTDGPGDALLVIRIPPQSIAEEVEPEGNPDLPAGTAQARISGESRLVFRLPDDVDSVPYTTAGLLEWSQLEPVLTPVARPGPGERPAEPPPITAPDPLHTAVEMPYRLVLSPDSRTSWRSNADRRRPQRPHRAVARAAGASATGRTARARRDRPRAGGGPRDLVAGPRRGRSPPRSRSHPRRAGIPHRVDPSRPARAGRAYLRFRGPGGPRYVSVLVPGLRPSDPVPGRALPARAGRGGPVVVVRSRRLASVRTAAGVSSRARHGRVGPPPLLRQRAGARPVELAAPELAGARPLRRGGLRGIAIPRTASGRVGDGHRAAVRDREQRAPGGPAATVQHRHRPSGLPLVRRCGLSRSGPRDAAAGRASDC